MLFTAVFAAGCEGQIERSAPAPLARTLSCDETAQTFRAPLDARFSGAGSCALGSAMGLGWLFHWGHGDKYPNDRELACLAQYPGQQQMLTVGKLDNEEAYDVAGLKQKYLKGEDEIEAYEQLENLLGNYADTDSALASYLMIPFYAEAAPGSYYQIANEPDWAPYFTPEDYAVHVHLYAERIRKYDPIAQVVLGGIAWGRYDHPYKWRSKELVEGEHMPQRLREIIATWPSEEAMLRRNAWVVLWLDAYRRIYRTEPPIDVWAVHPYSWVVGTADANGDFSSALAVEDSQKTVRSFRAFMDSPFARALEKPLWLTEFGPGQNQICGTRDECDQKSAKVIEFQNGFISWLVKEEVAQKWFWYFLRETPSSRETLASFMFTDDEGELNAVASNYRRLAQALGDTEAPTIDKITLRSEPEALGVIVADIESSDSGSGIRRVAYDFGKEPQENEVQDHHYPMGVRALTGIPLPRDTDSLRVVVEDNAGNRTSCSVTSPFQRVTN
ncbi:MAG: hypothetical protein H6715_03050 [Myxococcales bacterium]|nr:hypothetical protein [Myxococcales bacterium]MCB9708221.1 hypothetical protein [Myxococcales bacterium]